MLTCSPFAFALYAGAKHNKQAQLTLSEHCIFRYLLKTLLLYFKNSIVSLTSCFQGVNGFERIHDSQVVQIFKQLRFFNSKHIGYVSKHFYARHNFVVQNAINIANVLAYISA